MSDVISSCNLLDKNMKLKDIDINMIATKANILKDKKDFNSI